MAQRFLVPIITELCEEMCFQQLSVNLLCQWSNVLQSAFNTDGVVLANYIVLWKIIYFV